MCSETDYSFVEFLLYVLAFLGVLGHIYAIVWVIGRAWRNGRGGTNTNVNVNFKDAKRSKGRL